MNYFILSLIPALIYNLFKMKKSFHMLQQNWYNDDQRYFKWLLKNPYKVLLQPDMFFIMFIAGLFLDSKLLMIFYALFYITTTIIYKKELKKEQNKKPLAFTKRVRRLLVTTNILYLILILGFLLSYQEENITYYYLIISLTIYINYFVVMAANFINKPWEKSVYYYYFNKAKKKLKNMSNLKVIGITGSYGKTSSKNILASVLEPKYIVRPTPKNLNTPYGLMITINNYLDNFDEVLIAEMGAYVNGEIKEICDFVKPKYGILTIIGDAHLETFKTKKNICKTKFELIESLPDDGACVLNLDDPYQVSYVKNYLKSKAKILWIGVDNKEALYNATHIKCDSKGTNFDILYDNKTCHVETKLLGLHNVYNILAAFALGNYLGVNVDSMISKIKALTPTEHRLELKKLNNFMMIDDAYNSNPIGSSNALDVLGLMDGFKVIVTPGMVELGINEEKLNYEFGLKISKVCDLVILIGENRTRVIKKALLDNSYSSDNILVFNKLTNAFSYLEKLGLEKKQVYALFENDLPDIYNEGVDKNEN